MKELFHHLLFKLYCFIYPVSTKQEFCNQYSFYLSCIVSIVLKQEFFSISMVCLSKNFLIIPALLFKLHYCHLSCFFLRKNSFICPSSYTLVKKCVWSFPTQCSHQFCSRHFVRPHFVHDICLNTNSKSRY